MNLETVICPDWEDTRQPGAPSDQLSTRPASNQASPRTRGGSGSRPCSGNSRLGTDKSLEKQDREHRNTVIVVRQINPSATQNKIDPGKKYAEMNEEINQWYS